MGMSSYTRSFRARRGRVAARGVSRLARFCVVFCGTFTVACLFFGSDMLAYAEAGSFTLLGLTVMVCAIVAAATVNLKRGRVIRHREGLQDDVSNSATRDVLTDPFWYSPASPGYVFKKKH